MADASAAQASRVDRGNPASPTQATQVRLAAYPKGMPLEGLRASGGGSGAEGAAA